MASVMAVQAIGRVANRTRHRAVTDMSGVFTATLTGTDWVVDTLSDTRGQHDPSPAGVVASGNRRAAGAVRCSSTVVRTRRPPAAPKKPLGGAKVRVSSAASRPARAGVAVNR